MLTINNNGATRKVYLTRRYAFKLPRFSSWRLLLQGLLANLQERRFGTIGYSKSIAPVLFSDPIGLLIVMPRCEQPISDAHWGILSLGGTVDGLTTEVADDGDHEDPDYTDFVITDAMDNVIPGEMKPDGFGYLNGRLVVLDYGN